MLAIYKKELRSYFTTVIGFIYAALFLVIVGIYFIIYNLKYGYSRFEYVVNAIEFLYIILIPMLSMRLFAEEKKQKTDQLLFTSPISITKIVLGKYFAAFTMYLVPVVVMSFYPLIIGIYGEVILRTAYVTLLGFAILGATYMALGLFISTITENQVIALIVTAVIIFISYVMPGIIEMLPSDQMSAWLVLSSIYILICLFSYLAMKNWSFTVGLFVVGELILMAIYVFKPTFYDGIVAKVFNAFSISEKFTNFSSGILDFNAIIYFLSMIFMFLMITIQVIKKRRWN